MSMSTHTNEELYQAVASGEIEEVRKILDLGVNDIDGFGERVETPLTIASKNEDIPMVELLLNYNAEINQGNYLKKTPLYIAVEKKNLELVELLLDNGADVNAPSHTGITPIFKVSNNKKIFKRLIRSGANVNHQDNNGYTPLMEATIWSYIPIIKLLLAQGAKVNHENKNRETALSMAASRDDVEVVKILLANGATIGGLQMDREYEEEVEAILNKWPHTMWLTVLEDLFVYNHLGADSMEDLYEFVGPHRIGGKSKRRKTTKRPKTKKNSHKKRTKM
jgi:ankyrin repeat protein